MSKHPTPRGAGRAKRRQDVAAFKAIQCKLRDAAPEHRLPGDAPHAGLPNYYLDYLKRKSNDQRAS